ncbi:MAG TPA: hypothetical protein VFH68_10310 [Polyangia bacterium]|nr:hypothetical protein [Polyangia bacterium]
MIADRSIPARVRARRLGAPLWVCALLLVMSAPAGAASKRDQAKAAVEQAERQYKLARFDLALEDYARAYELFPAPALLFNLGQCHKQLKNHDRAIFFFEGYLRDEPRPANRRLAQELIAESRAELAKQEMAATAAEPPPVVPPAPAIAAGPVTPPPPLLLAPLVTASPPAPAPVPEARRSDHAWWLWVAIAAGVAAAGAFAYYETGAARTTTPGGTLGTIDRR